MYCGKILIFNREINGAVFFFNIVTLSLSFLSINLNATM